MVLVQSVNIVVIGWSLCSQ